MLYHAYQAHADSTAPLQSAARATARMFGDQGLPPAWKAAGRPLRRWTAACDVVATTQLTHRRLPFGIETVRVGDEEVAVVERALHTTPFATLLHFAKPALAGRDALSQPQVLIAAPMSGHFATLLRETVRTMLADHDVYITDWHNARDVPLAAGRFGLDEYTEHLMQFLAVLGEGAHLMAICQPCVASLAAVSLMSQDAHPATPKSLTLMAGPIDCRIDPTSVNLLATGKPLAWFEKNLISRVPWQHAGRGRRVYPGFLQLTAFVNMNRARHEASLRQMYDDLVAGDAAKAEPVRSFYREYMAVADLPAEFYLETVAQVFQDHDLPRGRLTFRGRPVDPGAVRRTTLLTVEGERDDICAPGQTLAAQDLCANLRPYQRKHYVQAGVGHYGVFSGKRWNSHIYPLVRDTIHLSQ